MAEHGDLNPGAVLDVKFTTVAATGAPTVLAGSPVVSIYKDNSLTQITAGVTLSVNFDSVVGLNNLRVDLAADGTAYSEGSNFQAVITTGTVGGVSVVGYVVASFSIRNRAALMPTVAGRTADLTASGTIGIDLANVENPTTVLDLSGVTIKTATDVETATQDLQSRTPAALVGGRTDSYVGAMATDVVTADALAADAVTEIQTGLATAAALTIVDDFLDTEVADIKAKTDQLTFTTPNVVDASGGGGGGLTGPQAAQLTAIETKTAALPSDPADQSLIIAATDAIMTRLGLPVAASIAADIAAIGGAAPTTAAIATAVWNKVVESQGSITAQQVMSIVLAMMTGVTENTGLTIKTPNGGATRVVGTVNALNERQTITLTPSAP